MTIKGLEIPETRSGKGRPVTRVISLYEHKNERIVAISGAEQADKKYVFCITRQGIAKRVELEKIASTTRAKRIMKLDPGDEIAQVRLTSGNDELLIITSDAQALRVNENEFRSVGRVARGVRAIVLNEGCKVINFDLVDDKSTVLVISRYGIGKRVSFDMFQSHHRFTAGIRIMELTEKTGELAAAVAVRDNDELVAISARGRMLRFSVNTVTIMKRHSTGNILFRLDEGDSLADCSIFRNDNEKIDGENENNNSKNETVDIPFDSVQEQN